MIFTAWCGITLLVFATIVLWSFYELIILPRIAKEPQKVNLEDIEQKFDEDDENSSETTESFSLISGQKTKLGKFH